MSYIVKIVPYNPDWPKIFEKEAKLIREVLGENCLYINHIGSTSVPGLAAKPTIDMIPVVKDITKVEQYINQMVKLGYSYEGEFGIAFRRFFQKKDNKISFNIHIYQENSYEIQRHIKFRDWLIECEEDRNGYEKLKRELADKYYDQSLKYSIYKTDFIRNIESKLGLEGYRLIKALTDEEWEFVKDIRQKEFFSKFNILDPYIWTFNHENHVHFIFYKGSKMIGYVHIQLWPENRAAMRIIVINVNYRNIGYGKDFLKLIEVWLEQQNINVLHVLASPKALKFYTSKNYIEMKYNDPDKNEIDPQDIELGKIL